MRLSIVASTSFLSIAGFVAPGSLAPWMVGRAAMGCSLVLERGVERWLSPTGRIGENVGEVIREVAEAVHFDQGRSGEGPDHDQVGGGGLGIGGKMERLNHGLAMLRPGGEAL